ncbi:MAG: glycoside hydrolase family 32 protein [Planctomycetes bacterium]|nr:glycoside hydrolase family 32 protein [Planctomycetota bacterium]
MKKILIFLILAQVGLLSHSSLFGKADKRFNQAHLNFESYLDIGYDQAYRPQFHFTSRKNWLNDPNGLIYYDGEYHLFFQHHALKNGNGTKSWGHAVSTDMIHWQQLQQAIVPYKVPSELIAEEWKKRWNGEVAIWSGTTVMDHKNILGKQKGDTKTMVAYYTATAKPHFFQAAAYSTDKGRTFTLLKDGGVVLPNQGLLKGERDPKVFWHEATQKYVMLIWVKEAKWGKEACDAAVRFFTSDNLLDWKKESTMERKWFAECMDVVELPVDGDSSNKKWLMYDASFDYEIGTFDGRAFTSESKKLCGDYGFHYYAAQTFNDSPDERKVMIGWMNERKHSPFVETKMPFDQQMSIPTELSLKTTSEGIRLFRWPVREIKSLHAKTKSIAKTSLKDLNVTMSKINSSLFDCSMEIIPQGDLVFDFCGIEIKYYHDKQFLQPTIIKQGYYKHKKLPALLKNGVLKMRALVDVASVELFMADGEAVGSYLGITNKNKPNIQIKGKENTQVLRAQMNTLKSIWP